MIWPNLYDCSAEWGEQTEVDLRSLAEFQDTICIEWDDEKFKTDEGWSHKIEFRIRISQKLRLMLVRNAGHGCSLYVGSNIDRPPCHLVFDRVRSNKSAYEIDKDWYGFVIEDFLTREQIEAMIDEDDDNTLKFHIKFPLDIPPGQIYAPDKIVTKQNDVNKLPFFEGFIEHLYLVEPPADLDYVPCDSNSPFNELHKMMHLSVTQSTPRMTDSVLLSSQSTFCEEEEPNANEISVDDELCSTVISMSEFETTARPISAIVSEVVVEKTKPGAKSESLPKPSPLKRLFQMASKTASKMLRPFKMF